MREHLCRLAEKLAGESSHSKWLLGAVVARGSRVMGMGVNVPRQFSVVSRDRHAEESAIRHARHRAKGADLYVTRVTSGKGVRSSSKPCLVCQEMIAQHGITRVFYTDELGEWHEMEVLPI